VLQGFEQAQASREAMRAVALDCGEAEVFARAALDLKYDAPDKPAPITESQVLAARRREDNRADLWSMFNRTQENLIRAGWSGTAAAGSPAYSPRLRHRLRPVPESCSVAAGQWPAPVESLNPTRRGCQAVGSFIQPQSLSLEWSLNGRSRMVMEQVAQLAHSQSRLTHAHLLNESHHLLIFTRDLVYRHCCAGSKLGGFTSMNR